MASGQKPVRHGEMKLTIPQGDKCHPVVGRSYKEQCEHQLSLVIGLLTGGKGSLPDLPREEFPGPDFWNQLRQVRDNAIKMNESLSDGEAEGSAREKEQVDQVSEIDEAAITSQRTLFEQILAVVPVGREVVAYLWSVDTLAVGRLASASKACSDAVAIYVSRFHLPLGDYQDCDWLPAVFNGIEETRRSTIGIGRNLFIRGRDLDVVPGDIKGIPKAWSSCETRDTLWNVAQDNKADADTYRKFFPFLVNNQRLHDAEAKLHSRRREQGLPPRKTGGQHLREISYNIPMLRSLNQYGHALEALRLHEIPMMDLRIVEMILSTCPKLEIIGIIKCELLHVGHINPLLDLIYWNGKRMSKKPVNLQFYPRAYFGPLKNRLGTHVVSWDPISVNVQTSLLATVFLAVMKAIPMGIDLMSKDQDFRRFFDLVPMKPGQGSIFIHHVFTWTQAATSPLSYALLPDHIREDLEDQVVLSLLQGSGQRMKYHEREEHFRQGTCSLCSNTMIRAFFRKEMETRQPSFWVCRICDLHYALDGEAHHRLVAKRDLLDLFLSSPDELVHRPSQISQRDLEEVVAHLLVNPFARSPALHSVARTEAVHDHRSLLKVHDLIAPQRDYATLGASAEAALLDVADQLQELNGVHMDHPTLTQQNFPSWVSLKGKRARKQSLEYVLWKDVVEDTEEHKVSRFW